MVLELESETDVQKAMMGLPGIAKVEKTTTLPHHFTIFPEQGKDIYSTVNAKAQEEQWPVRALHVERGRLDDVFRQITQAPVTMEAQS